MKNDLESILLKCLEKDDKAISQLYDMIAGFLYAICLRYANSSEEAQDLLQDSFIKIYQKLDTLKDLKTFKGWAKRIAVNEALQQIRKAKLIFEDASHEEAQQIADQSDIFSELTKQELLEMINQLPTGKKTVFNLYCIEGFSHKEIAEMLEITESTSKTQLLKAKKELQEMLKLKY